MHDELQRTGLRRMRVWIAVLVLVGAVAGAFVASTASLEPEWPVTDETVEGGMQTIALGAGAGAVFVVLLLLSNPDRRAARRAWPKAVLEPAPQLRPLIEGLALARGEEVPRVWRLASSAPNVACLPGPGGRHVVVSTAAERGFARDELEALVALQFSLLVDPDARRVRRALVGASRVIVWVIWATLIATTVVVVREPVWSGLTINIGIWVGIGLVALVALVQRRVRWAWGIVGDGVAIETTRYPEPLVRALRRLAGYNDEQVRVKRSFGAADPFWAAAVRARVSMATMVVNDRARSRTSTEQVTDIALLLRAGIVERVCLGGEPNTLASWEHAKAVFEQVGLAAGDWGGGDAQVHGVVVTTEGAVAGLPGPVSHAPLVNPADAAARKRRRPWIPDRNALAAYDRIIAGSE